MEFRGEDDEMGFNVEQAARGIIGCAIAGAVAIGAFVLMGLFVVYQLVTA